MSTEERDRLLEWLLVNGGPVVRYRTAAELCGDLPSLELARLENDLLAFPPVNQALNRLELGNLAGVLDHLTPPALTRLGRLVHGSQPNALENVLGRLNELGVRAGMAALDQRMLPIMRIFHGDSSWQEDTQYRSAWESLVKSIFAWGLLRADYRPDPVMQEYLSSQVNIIHKIARDQVFDIYACGDELKGLPQPWSGKPILKQEVMAGYHLPLIHDLYMLANLPAWMVEEDTAAKINEVINYVLDPRFQALAPGYGYAWIKDRRTCYSWGWSPHLAGYASLSWQDPHAAGVLVQQMELMVNFTTARETRWFQAGLRQLEWYRTTEGTYRFPAHYLRDQSSGYYVNGSSMGLGENRRSSRALEIESTFRMVRIRAALAGCFERILL